MPKYFFQASYNDKGWKGLVAEGASNRVESVRSMVKEAGGSIETFYYAFGDDDAIIIAEFPDNETAASFSFAVNSSGAVTLKTTVLMAPNEVDRATQKTVNYRPPGE